MGTFDIGMIGLAVMGRSLALNMADKGFRVAGYNRSREVTEAMVKEYPHDNFTPFYDLREFVEALARPRKVMLMIKAGGAVDAVIGQLTELLEEGDIILDGGNSFFEDTRRRYEALKEKGIRYFGVGISGGEEGARRGPSIMPGGEKEAYEQIRPVLEKIAAYAEGEPCCTYIGPDGAGHYVKMVHNGIEYADMQLIAEAYILLKSVAGYTNAELGDIFEEWNQGELKSYLIGITADIFREKDDFEAGELLDYIVDSAAQKGTGRWASIESMKQGVDISMITSVCSARIMSNHLDARKKAFGLVDAPGVSPAADKEQFAAMVREALYTGKIIAYAQGFSLMQDASLQYGWNLDLGKIASIFRAGCIIQAVFLNDITKAFETRSEDGGKPENLIFDRFFLSRINEHQDSLRKAVSTGVMNGLSG